MNNIDDKICDAFFSIFNVRRTISEILNIDILNEPITFLNIKIRTTTILNNNKILTISDLLNYPIDNLKDLHQIGPSLLSEVYYNIIQLKNLMDLIHKKNKTYNKSLIKQEKQSNDAKSSTLFTDFQLSLPLLIQPIFKKEDIRDISQFLKTPPFYINSKYRIPRKILIIISDLFIKYFKQEYQNITFKDYFFGTNEIELIINDYTQTDIYIKALPTNETYLYILKKMKVSTIRELLNLPLSDINPRTYKTILAVYNYIKSYIFIVSQPEPIQNEYNEVLTLLVKDIETYVKGIYPLSTISSRLTSGDDDLHNLLTQWDHKSNLLEDSIFINTLYKEETMIHLGKNILLLLLPYKKILSKEELFILLPVQLRCTSLYDNLLALLEAEHKIFHKGNFITKNIQRYREWLDNSNLDKESYSLCIKRLEGQVADKIAKQQEVTRECIYRKWEKCHYKKSIVFEDIYQYYFETYNFKKEIFTFVFDETEETYRYLILMYKKGSIPLEEITVNTDFDDFIKQRYAKYVS